MNRPSGGLHHDTLQVGEQGGHADLVQNGTVEEAREKARGSFSAYSSIRIFELA
jgi:hypothetical protein